MKLGFLEKICSTHKNLRTDSMEGIFEELPKVGETFKIYGEGLVFGNRYIHTSPIVEIVEAGKSDKEYFIFKTMNSTYKITVLADSEVEASEYLKENFKESDVSFLQVSEECLDALMKKDSESIS